MIMKSTFNALKLSSIIILAITSGCAGEPDFAVDTIPGSSSGGGAGGAATIVIDEEDKITEKAIVFKGNDLFLGTSCNVSLALHEENGSHTWLASVDYTLHGEDLPDLALSEYRFDINTQSYHSISENEGNPVLVGGVLNNGGDFHAEDIQDYVLNFELAYSLQIDFPAAADLESFEETMEEVLADPSKIANLNNNLSRIVFRLLHNGHYDAGGCSLTQALSVTETTFDLHLDKHADSDGHDHDHDHDDH